VRKGSLFIMRGRLQTRNWADAKYPEVKHYRTEIIADTVELGPKLSKQEEASPLPPAPDTAEAEAMPF